MTMIGRKKLLLRAVFLWLIERLAGLAHRELHGRRGERHEESVTSHLAPLDRDATARRRRTAA